MMGNDESTIFYDAISMPNPSVDPLANMMAEFQKGQIKAEEHPERQKMEEEEHCVVLEEHAQHMKLIEMFYSGSISLKMYNAMKSKGF
jgi:hypothetical protein